MLNYSFHPHVNAMDNMHISLKSELIFFYSVVFRRIVFVDFHGGTVNSSPNL